MIKYTCEIKGMTCENCEKRVSAILRNFGARNIETSYQQGRAVFYHENTIDKSSIDEAFDNTAYQVKTLEKTEKDKNEKYDFLIIGSGGAAFASAIKASELGAKVAMVERDTIGGTCVNIGCVPSKTLLKAGEINRLAKTNPFTGLHTNAESVDLASLVSQKDALVGTLRKKKYIDLLDEYGIDLIRGEAKFINEKSIAVNNHTYFADKFLIATGARPAVPAIKGLNSVDYLTSTTLLELKELPKRLTVIGSGYVGIELGQLFHNLGSEVTLMLRSDRLFKHSEPEASSNIEKALEEQGINIIKEVVYQHVEQIGDIKKVHVKVDGKTEVVESEALLIAAGRSPNTEALNLSAANVKTGKHSEIVIDAYASTSNENIFAAGDVTLGPQFVYVAAYEGGLVAENAIGNINRKLNLSHVPSVVFTTPSLSSVGMTESSAKQKGYEVKNSVVPIDSVPRANVNHENIGMIKMVADAKTHKILGVHIVSDNAEEVIYSGTLAVKFALTIEDLKDTMAPYLTMSEGMKLAAITFDKAVSKLSCCAG